MSGEKPLSLTPLKMGQHKMKTKRKQFKAVSQKVKLFRSKDPLISVLSWGVNHTITELSRVTVPAMLLPDDFKAHSKIRVDNHLYNKENLPSHFKFKEYCPLVFKNLRERFGIDDQKYYRSFQVPLLTAGSPGRSGANFFLTQDKRFYIKQLESEEVERLHTLLPQYHQYIVERHARTLLPHYLGMYRITVDSKETYLFVMRNVFSGHHKVHKKYDLKGSTVDRQASDKEKSKELPTYKDLDFCKDNVKITVSEDDKVDLMDRVKADVEFLASLNIMDYSLLVGIHDPERGDEDDDEEEVEDDQMRSDSNDDSECDSPSEMMVSTPPGPLPQTPETPPPDSPRFRTISFGSNGEDIDPCEEEVFSITSSMEGHKEIYFMGIVDVLTYYGATKKAAHAAKTVKHGVSRPFSSFSSNGASPGNSFAGAEISTVKPEAYARRFVEFVDKIVA